MRQYTASVVSTKLSAQDGTALQIRLRAESFRQLPMEEQTAQGVQTALRQMREALTTLSG
jgi:hypothetical protein